MAEINQTIWGDEQYWIDIAYDYPEALDVKEKVQWASYDGSHDIVYDFLHDDRIEANKHIDSSLSWCGLGEHSPYNRLTYYCGAEAYSYRFNDGNIPWTTYDDNSQEQVVVQETDITNFAMGRSTQGGSVYDLIPILNRSNTQLDRFHKFWGPNSVIDTLDPDPQHTVPYDWNRTLQTSYYARVPVKNIICIPMIVAMDSISTTEPNYVSVDLKTYLNPEASNSFVHYPYVVSGQMSMWTDKEGSKMESGTHNRNTSLGVNTVSMLKNLTMLNGAPANYSISATDRYVNPASVQFESDSCICYELIYGDFLPIYGLITGAFAERNFANCRHPYVDVPYQDGTSWDWKAINYNHFELNVNAPSIFTWAGEDPTITVYNPTSREGCRRYIYKEITALNKEEFRETIRRAVACFGLFFVDGVEDRDKNLDHNDVMLGILENGVGNGKYSHGEENRDQDQWNWDDMHQNDYDPSNPPEPGDNPSPSGDPMLPVGLTWTLANTGTGIWALTPSEISQVWKDIFGSDVKATAFGDQPLNAILSLEWTPFTWTTNDDSPIILGDQIVNALHAYPLVDSASEAEQHAAGQMRFKFNKNFYNARYMQARLFLPFYGYYELPVAQLLSSQLRVDFYYNIPDELAVYIISYDKVIYDFVECNCKIEIPITGSNAAAIRENKRAEALTIATQVAALAATAYFGASGIKAVGAGLTQIAAAATETASITGGSFIGAALQNVGPLAGENLLKGFGKGLVGAGAAVGGASVGGVNTIHKAEVQRAALRTNLPYHGSALQTTFLHMSMKPYVQIFKNAILGNLKTEEGETVKVELGGTDETQYKLKVGHACDKFCTIQDMDEGCLLQTTGCGDMSSMGMELSEYQELNAILQSGFYK